MKGRYKVKNERMMKYLVVVRALIMEFHSCNIIKILRAKNSEANRLSKCTSVAIPNLEKGKEKVFVKYLLERNTLKQVHMVLDLQVALPTLSWIDSIVSYLNNGTLPSHKKEASSFMYRAANYTMINNMLYKQGFSFPFLRYL